MPSASPIGQSGEPAQLWELEILFSNVLIIALALLGIVLFLMLVSGGFKYITAGSSPDRSQSAKNTITYAILGIVLAASAYLILQLISWFTGAPILNFTIFQN